MIKERYVSLEVARLLKDKGFDEECTKLYNINNRLWQQLRVIQT